MPYPFGLTGKIQTAGAAMPDAPKIVEGRSCEGCSMCCFLLEVATLGKPVNAWCRHCPTKQRCTVYPDRPAECREFHCGWLTTPSVGDEWAPRRSRIVLAAELDGQRMTAIVHPDRPGAWRREPYYRQLKAWAEAAVAFKGQVVAKLGNRYTVILPDRDVDLGELGPDEMIVTAITPTPSGPAQEPMKLHRDDPRAANLR